MVPCGREAHAHPAPAEHVPESITPPSTAAARRHVQRPSPLAPHISTKKTRTSPRERHARPHAQEPHVPTRKEGPPIHTSRRLAARLTATASATCLAAAGLALIPAGEASAAGAPQGGHVYTLTAAHSGKNAAVLSDSLANGAAVVQKTASGGPRQLWEAVAHGDGTFSLVNINSGKCMDVASGSVTAGAKIIQWPCTGATNQNWAVSGSAIVSARSGLCLDVSGGSTAEDTAVVQWTCNGQTNQQGSLTERPRSATWSPAMVSGGQTFNEQTIRMVVHNNTSGAGLRIRLSNLRSTTALSVGAVRIIGGTILPNSTQTAAKAAIRAQVNNWIRTSGAFDAVIDFDAALRDPANPAQLLPAYDSGDHLHPNSAGMQAIANTVNLSLLTS
ncbi:hypothetical protein GCM10017771_29440 [Streptomyces capitiformicae]|uniref:Ricin B lectin domain-containing protein n=1 Tax=Streptomyces capitiformicae TaxID=2014920 RepID=A0A919GMX1_9ACTN|nr:hypothetical protein GCM10017771_29440 [Streptomyces capitiformicae]